MKRFLQIYFLVASLLFNAVALAEAPPDPTQCSGSEQTAEFDFYWKVTSITNFSFAKLFCESGAPEAVNSCAANLALNGKLRDLLKNYTLGTQECGDHIIKTCTAWCLGYLPANECAQKCVLPNFKIIE